MKNTVPAWAALASITLAAGLLLGLTDGLTQNAIAKQIEASALSARRSLFPDADEFIEQELNDGVDSLYAAMSDGTELGRVAQITVKGYGGDIEVTTGLDESGILTGVLVGGASFSETAGLGAKTREPGFTSQFTGLTPPAVLWENVDAVTGATISSNAVVSGVNKAVKYMQGEASDQPQGLLFGVAPGAVDYTELTSDGTVDEAYMTDNGICVSTVTVKGYHGNIHVTAGVDASGAVTGVWIDTTDFNETAGLGEKVLEQGYLDQYKGLSGIIGVDTSTPYTGVPDAVSEPTGDTDAESAATHNSADSVSGATQEVPTIEGATSSINAVSGATISSTAVTEAVNAAIAFSAYVR